MALQVVVRPIITTLSAPTQGLALIITVWNRGNEYALLEEMNCSWDSHYCFDRDGVGFEGWSCYRNFLEMRILAPNEKVTHQQTSLSFYKPQPRVFSFRVGLIQPAYKVRQADLEKAYHSPGYPIQTAAARQQTRKRPPLTTWSAPVRVHARTTWHHW